MDIHGLLRLYVSKIEKEILVTKHSLYDFASYFLLL